jgi:diguanylate cyclase (GGDEF)-like protein
MMELLKRVFRAGLVTVLVLGIFVSLFTVKYVSAEESQTVKVGFYKIDGFMYYDDLGNPAGYCVDYLKRVAMITGWNYEFVEIRNWEDGKEKLLNNEVDMIAPCQLDIDQMELFEYSQYSFGTEYSVIVARAADDEIYYEDYDGMNGKKIGIVRSFYPVSHFDDYMETNSFTVQTVYYNTLDEVDNALDRGDVDLILMSQMMVGDNQKIVARFSPYPFYFMTRKNNVDILDKLNDAMQNLKNTYPGLENELLTTYFPLYNILFFTREEQEFIDSLKPIKVAYVSGNIPISFQNPKTGELGGMSREIFDKIQEVSGLKFEYEMLPEGDITYDYLRENGFDLITGVRYNRSNLYSKGIMLSNPYLSSKMVLVGNDAVDFDVNGSYTVAVVSGSQTLKNEITSNYPNFTVVSLNSVQECFESVRDKKTDLLMTDRYIANYWLSKPVYGEMHTIPVDELMDELSFSVVVDINGNQTLSGLDGVKLVSIINKTLSQISQAEIDEIIINENNANRYEYTLEDFVYLYRYAFIIGIVAIIIMALFYLYGRNIKKRARIEQELEAQRISIQNKKYKMMMDRSCELLYDINITENSGFVSEQFKERFGWSMPDSVTDFSKEGIRDLLHIHPDEWEQESDEIIKSLDKNQPCDSLVRIMTKDGEGVRCNISFYPILNDEKQLSSIIGKIEEVKGETGENDNPKLEVHTDKMTGLMNKQTFETNAEKQLGEKSAYHCAIIFVDLDHFKNLNDTLGHSIGDDAIKEAAQNLKGLFENEDLVSRFGGDEFCILVCDIAENTLKEKLEKTIDSLKKTYTDGSMQAEVTASVGAVYCKMRSSDYKTLFNLADIAVYEAKEKGRNQYILKEL